VILPVYNRRDMAREALESIMRQSRSPDEIWLVDDGSTDGSAETARDFPKVRLLRQENRGISAARNAGIRSSSGNLIAFLDSDDLWLADKLRLQERFLDSHPSLPLCHTEEIWIRNGKRVNPRQYHRKEGGRIFQRSLERCLISPSSVMIRRELLDEVGLFDESLPVCEDYDLWLRVTARHAVGFLEEPLIVKRGGHADQLSRKLNAMDRYRLDAIEKALTTQPLHPDDRRAALRVFLEKARILRNGLRKRKRGDEAEELKRRWKRLRQR